MITNKKYNLYEGCFILSALTDLIFEPPTNRLHFI